MPWLSADEVDVGVFLLRLLILGFAKVGKTTAAIMTAPGPVGVGLTDDMSGLRETRRQCIEKGLTKRYRVRDWRHAGYKQLVYEIEEIKRDARKGRIKSFVVDNLLGVSNNLFIECFQETLTKMRQEDGRKAYPLYTRRIIKVVSLLLEIECNVIVISHYIQPSAQSDEQRAKEGPTPEDAVIIPGLETKLAAGRIPGMFTDIIYMGYDVSRERRYFLTGPRGAIVGPGCRSLRSTTELPASIMSLLRAFGASPAKKPASSAQPVTKPTTEAVE